MKALATLRFTTVTSLAALSSILWSHSAAAEVALYKPDADAGWEVFVDGRINSFIQYARGEATPLNAATHQLQGEPLPAFAIREIDPANPSMIPQGTIEQMRVANGFLGSILGFGVRRKLGESTTVTGHIALWIHSDSTGYRKYYPSYPDAREAWIKLEGSWGSVTAGRALTLFSRGGTEINFLYGHGFGAGFAGSLASNGPAAGHVGFGVLANGFASGVMYATPSLAGLQLSAGVYDPAALTGQRYERTKLLRPEAELTYDASLGALGKVHLFANGTMQRVYLPATSDDVGLTIRGAGYGGRIELGPVRLGLAGHYGRGLGVNYALDPSPASLDEFRPVPALRLSSGYYAQGMLVLGPVDVAAGAGVTQIKFDAEDSARTIVEATGEPQYSVLKQQLGLSAGVIYHAADWLHFDLDYFRAQFQWTLGEKQAVNFINAGTTVTW